MTKKHPILARLYQNIPFAVACKLHQRLRAGCTAPETRQLLRMAMVRAGLVQERAA
ncbi:MAG: hypothetical protein WC340_18810 [Kiritimatiellia bacterium]